MDRGDGAREGWQPRRPRCTVRYCRQPGWLRRVQLLTHPSGKHKLAVCDVVPQLDPLISITGGQVLAGPKCR